MDATNGRGRGGQGGAPVRRAGLIPAIEAGGVIAPDLVDARHAAQAKGLPRACGPEGAGPATDEAPVQGGVPPDATRQAAGVATASGARGPAGGPTPVVAVRAPEAVEVAAVGAAKVPTPGVEAPAAAPATEAIAAAAQVVPMGQAAAVPPVEVAARDGGAAVEAVTVKRTAAAAPASAGDAVAAVVPLAETVPAPS